MSAFITHRHSLVHRLISVPGCEVARKAPTRREVTPLQALVYRLGRCVDCWPRQGSYEAWMHEGQVAA
jgi:hypothetical protein